MRTRPPDLNRNRPLRVNVLSGDGYLRQRLVVLERRAPVQLRYSDAPLAASDTDAYVIPVAELHRLSRVAEPTSVPSDPTPLLLAFGPRQYLRSAFLAGCDDYLKDPWDPEELEVRLLRLAARREARRERTMGGYELEGKRLRLPDGREVLLSAHEAVVAGLLLSNRGAVVSRRTLAYALWGRLPDSPSRAVDMHVSALRRKLGRISISCVRGQGYVVD